MRKKLNRSYVTPNDPWPRWTVVAGLLVVVVLLVIRLWGYDWDWKCFFVECRKVIP